MKHGRGNTGNLENKFTSNIISKGKGEERSAKAKERKGLKFCMSTFINSFPILLCNNSKCSDFKQSFILTQSVRQFCLT